MVLTICLLVALGGGRAPLQQVAQADWRWLALATLIHYSGFAVRGWRWQQLLQMMGYRLRWRKVTVLLLSGWFVSALLPARAGDLLRVAVLQQPAADRPPVPVAASLGSIVLERALDLLAILLLGALLGLLLLRAMLPGWVVAAYVTGLGGLLLLTGTVLVAPALLDKLRSWAPAPLWHKGLDFAGQVVASLRTCASQPRLAPAVLGASLYIWLCDALLMWLAVGSLGQWLPFGQLSFVALTVDVFALVPLTPGGIGQIETVNAALLALLPLPTATVAAAVLINRAISYWSFLLCTGAITFIYFALVRTALFPAGQKGSSNPTAV